MALAFDHLVIAARELGAGVAWAEERLGVSFGPGGRHAAMSTHNRLLSLGPRRFLEVIAVDPEAPDPGRPRWFELDAPAMRSRLADGPHLVHWVVRSDALERDLAALHRPDCEILALSRGDFRWRIGVPRDGRLALGGVMPTLLQWDGAHPAERLPDAGCRLERLALRHPDAASVLAALEKAGLADGEVVAGTGLAEGLSARIATPRGVVEIPP